MRAADEAVSSLSHRLRAGHAAALVFGCWLVSHITLVSARPPRKKATNATRKRAQNSTVIQAIVQAAAVHH